MVQKWTEIPTLTLHADIYIVMNGGYAYLNLNKNVLYRLNLSNILICALHNYVYKLQFPSQGIQTSWKNIELTFYTSRNN